MPEKVISDHGPQFNGQEFEQFSVQRKLKDSTFVPSPHHSYYPQVHGKSHQNTEARIK